MIFLIRKILGEGLNKTVVYVDESEICIACGCYIPDGGMLCQKCIIESKEGEDE